MKTISLWQPWATLIAIGAKTFETRSWSIAYRGALLIHASKRTIDLAYWFNQPLFHQTLTHAGYLSWRDLPLGKALCVVSLTRIYLAEEVRYQLSATERAFGDYANSRFAWKLEDVRRLARPVELRGAQGLFDCSIVPEYERAT